MFCLKLKVVSSGSKGNGYILESENEVLLVEAGCKPLDIKEAIDFKTSKIVGCIVSHSHLDHSKYAEDYKKMGIKVIEPYKDETKSTVAGKFKINFFPVIHDVPTYGAVITEPTMGKLVFVTDAEYVKYTFPGVNHIMVEANYSQDILDENMNSGEIHKALRDRIMKSHMSFDTAKGMVKANKNPMLRNVILCHLSSHNSDKKRFEKEMKDVAGQFCNVTVAQKGVEVDLGLCPF